MKKTVMLLTMSFMLSGCEMSYSRYVALVERCDRLGGTPIVDKTDHGTPWKVRCQIGEMVFMQGDY